MRNAPTNTDDVIDSRDVIARIRELEDERDAFVPEEISAADLVDPSLAVVDRPPQSWEEANPDDADELAALISLQEQSEGYSDWHHGVTLIRDSYFEEYARQYADDIGAVDSNAPWPANCIDWESAAEELQHDYTAVEFDGVTYLVR